MAAEANMQCLTCGWAFHVAPKNQTKPEFRACPACGSGDTIADHETPPKPSLEVPNTKHVREVLAKAEEVGLEMTEVQPWRGGAYATFRKGHRYLRVQFDARGYIRSADGSSPRSNSWVISVSNERYFPCSPKRALDVLVNHTMPEYAEVTV